EGLRLVQERGEVGRVPFQGRAPGVVGRTEGRADPEVGAPEDALCGVVEEGLQAFTDGFVGEREGGGEVLGDVAAYLGGGERGLHRQGSPFQVPSRLARSTISVKCAWASRYSASRSAL